MSKFDRRQVARDLKSIPSNSTMGKVYTTILNEATDSQLNEINQAIESGETSRAVSLINNILKPFNLWIK